MKVKGFKPHPDQRKKIDLIESDDCKYITLTTGRQWGKTILAENLLLKWALTNNQANCMWVSPVYAQANKVFEELLKAIQDTPVFQSYNKGNLSLTFVNGSVIHFKSAERYDNLRGFTLDYLVIDEAAFIKDNVWNMILKPTILVKGKKVLFISTPKGKNFLFELHLRGIDIDQKNYISLRGTSYDTPFIDKSEVEEAKRALPEDIFKQEILGEFIDNGGEVFADIERHQSIPEWIPVNPERKYYAGIDFGRQNDYTVLTILDDLGRVCFIYRDRHKPWSEIINNCIRYLNEYRATCQVEVNSMGDVLYEQIKKKYNDVHPFVTTSASKQNIIEDLIYAFNESQVLIPTEELFPPLSNELKIFTFTYSPKTRRVSYGAMEGGHDDTIMSLAIGYNSLKSKKTKGSYYVY